MARTTMPAPPVFRRALLFTLALTGCSRPPSRPPSHSVAGPVASPATASPPTEEPAPTLPPLDSGVVLEFVVDTSWPGRPTLVGRTNLPNGTSIMTEVEGGPAHELFGQDQAVVRSGGFRAGPWASDSGLPAGHYTAEALMPIPRVQDDSVKAIIGPKGERLRGKLVRREAIGVTVVRRVPFTVGTSSEAVAAAKARTTQQRDELQKATSLLREVRKLIRTGRAMEPLRQAPGLQDADRCTAVMRRNQQVADSLDALAQTLPDVFGGYLGYAARIGQLCSSCWKPALEDCADAARSANEAERLISELRHDLRAW